jgi:hypothetical protein
VYSLPNLGNRNFASNFLNEINGDKENCYFLWCVALNDSFKRPTSAYLPCPLPKPFRTQKISVYGV